MFPHNFFFFFLLLDLHQCSAFWQHEKNMQLLQWTAWAQHQLIYMHLMATWFPPSVVTNVQCSQNKLSKFSSSERHHFLCQGSIVCIWLSCQVNCFWSLWSSSLLKANTSAEWFDPSGQLAPQTFLVLYIWCLQSFDGYIDAYFSP